MHLGIGLIHMVTGVVILYCFNDYISEQQPYLVDIRRNPPFVQDQKSFPGIPLNISSFVNKIKLITF